MSTHTRPRGRSRDRQSVHRSRHTTPARKDRWEAEALYVLLSSAKQTALLLSHHLDGHRCQEHDGQGCDQCGLAWEAEKVLALLDALPVESYLFDLGRLEDLCPRLLPMLREMLAADAGA